MVAVALIVSKFFSLPDIIPNNLFAASLSASGDDAEIIIAARFAPIRFTPKWCVKAGKSGATHIPTTSTSTGGGTPKRSAGTASCNMGATNAAAFDIL